MSDVQVVEVAEQVSPPAAVEVAPAEGQTAPEVAAPETPPAKTFTQSDLDRILAKERAKAERKAERLGYERARREVAESQLQQPRNEAPPPADGEPTPDQFQTFTEYSKALARWEVRQELRGLGERAQQMRETQTAQQRAAEVQQKLAPAMEKYEDFDEVVFNERLPITEAMAEAALELGEVGHDVLYHLGTHPKEAERIAALGRVGQVREIDKIAQSLSKPPEPTKAPPPIKPNEGTAPVEKRLDEASYDEFVKIRRRQIAAKRG